MKSKKINARAVDMNLKTNLKIDYCSYTAAKFAVMKWHYSKSMPIGKLVKFGVWENENFIGSVIFGMGASDSLGKKYGLTHFQTCELVRVALNKHINPVTKIIAISIKLLKQYCPKLELIVSYSDLNQNHLGIIYQAGNWKYDGKTKPDKAYKFNNIVYHSRHISGSGKKKIFDKIVKVPKPSECEIIQLKSKHKYLYPLTKKMRKQILQLEKPYPKSLNCVSSVNGSTSSFQDEGNVRFDSDAQDVKN